jgi:hypothetical protein
MRIRLDTDEHWRTDALVSDFFEEMYALRMGFPELSHDHLLDLFLLSLLPFCLLLLSFLLVSHGAIWFMDLHLGM